MNDIFAPKKLQDCMMDKGRPVLLNENEDSRDVISLDQLLMGSGDDENAALRLCSPMKG